MKTGDLGSGLGQLTHAFSTLKDRWAEVKSHWHDEAGQQFEKQYLAPIPGKLQVTITAVQRLADVLAALARDLDDRGDADGAA